MTTPALDNSQRSRFNWPEPLVLDLIGECYGAHDDGDRWTAARHHARFLRDLVEGETMHTPAARLELMACCVARGIGADLIEAAEQAVIDELVSLVQMRFRNSPQTRDFFLRRLQAARQPVTRRTELARKAVAPLRGRVPLRLRPSLIPTAA